MKGFYITLVYQLFGVNISFLCYRQIPLNVTKILILQSVLSPLFICRETQCSIFVHLTCMHLCLDFFHPSLPILLFWSDLGEYLLQDMLLSLHLLVPTLERPCHVFFEPIFPISQTIISKVLTDVLPYDNVSLWPSAPPT